MVIQSEDVAAVEPQLQPIPDQQEHPLKEIPTVAFHETLTNDKDTNIDDGGCPPIAIVGMALRLPGGVKSPDELWKFLMEKKNGVCEVPGSRYTVDSFYSDSKAHCLKTRHGYYLEEDIACFDAPFFSISSSEAAQLDPQQRMLMEIVWECLESAGETNWKGKNIGCYVGVYGEDWLDLASKDPQYTNRYHVFATGQFALSNRLSWEYDFRGPSMTLQAGCSSSLIGLHEACHALYAGDCCAAIVAGTNLIFTPTMTTTMCDNNVLSPSGACKTFDKDADGYGRGEGINALYIKTLADALRDNDPIRGVIRATATNFDGKTSTITTPGAESQEALVRRAYEKAGINDICQTGFFECHGTGTVAGDTTETSVVAKLFEGKGIVIGSVKPNLGHGEGASGITSVIKGIMSLQHDTIPPNTFFQSPNPNIPFKESKLQVPLDAMPWPEGRSKRVSVNCFGIGGANSHAILDSASSFCKSEAKSSVGQYNSSHLLVVSARSAENLRERVNIATQYINENPSKLHDLAYTLAVRREHLSHRAFAIAQPGQPISATAFQNGQDEFPELVFVFTGQGAQWVGMGKDLMHAFPEARKDIQALEKVLQGLPDAPNWSLEGELAKVGDDSKANEAEFSQPLCTALQIALVNILYTWGIKPSSLVGHSSGEIAAAYASGAITARSAIIIAYYRGMVAKELKKNGAMAAVGLGKDKATQYLVDGVVVSCENSPGSVTLSGDADKVDKVVGTIKNELPDVLCRRLRVSVAYHSHHMQELGPLYESRITQFVEYNERVAHINGVSIDLKKINGVGETLSNIPPYPWQHGAKYWHAIESSDLEPSWRNVLRLDDVPWLTDHALQGNIIFPATGYVAMAGEAICQLDSGADGYTIKNFAIKNPLLLKNEAEIITAFRPVKITDMVDSEWYSFTIMAHDGSGWTKHCQGQVRAGSENPPKGYKIKDQTRVLDVDTCYKLVDRQGFSYGPHFRRFQDINVHPTECKASGTVLDFQDRFESRYNLHPATMDHVLQLFPIAQARGFARRLGLIVPTIIGEIYVRGSAPQLKIEACIPQGGFGAGRAGQAIVMADDELVLSLKDIFGFPVDNQGNTEASNVPLGSQIRWAPDIDMVSPPTLLPTPTVEERYYKMARDVRQVSLIYILETADRLACITPTAPSLVKWKNWITVEASRLHQSLDTLSSKMQDWVQMNSEARQLLTSAISSRYDDEKDGSSVPFECMRHIYDHCQEIACGKSVADRAIDCMEKYWPVLQSQCDWSHFLRLLGHSNPAMRVLEISAGTGSATRVVLQHLKSPEGALLHLYSQYTFTDASESMVTAAQKMFPQCTEYKVLDISKDPKEQGFEPHSFDLIIASNVLHSTPRLEEALRNIGHLLADNGRFLLHELHPRTEPPLDSRAMGILPDWWVGDEDGRLEHPYVSPERWNQELIAAGFVGNEVMCYDLEPSNSTTFTILSKMAQVPNNKTDVFLLAGEVRGPWAKEIESSLVSRGYRVNWGTLNEDPPVDQLIVSLLDMDGPYLHAMPAQKYAALHAFLTKISKSKMIWVTSRSQLACIDPRFSLIFGLARTLRHEMALDISTFETDVFDTAAANALILVLEKLEWSRQLPNVEPEYEFSFYHGTINIGRCHWQLPQIQESDQALLEAPIKLEIGSRGSINTLQWARFEEGPLESDHVEVEMRYIGLNFRDIMVAMGLYGDPDEFGIEGSGIVCRVAPGLDYKPGDKVAVISTGAFRTRAVLPSHMVIKIPDDFTLEDAATMLCGYFTSLICLIHLARVREGESVLIHSACGGVGLAAIRICEALGAKIFATVGNDEKVKYLTDQFGIPRHRIFNSRNAGFLPGIMRETNGRGVDVVLNSLAGKLLHASWDCVAPFGKMVELGKRDFISNGQLNMAPFIDNRQYIGFDLTQYGTAKHYLRKVATEQFIQWFNEGKSQPIRPIKVYDATKVVDAFRYMQQGVHIGKILIRMPQDPVDLLRADGPSVITFSPNASYLLVGGLGGLGRSVSSWMAENGARHIVYLSRSAGKSAKDQAFLRELEDQGCSATCVAGNVADMADVKSAISKCPKRLVGIIQLSTVLKVNSFVSGKADRTFEKMTHDEWSSCLESKVQGTWNLHDASRDKKLDFFVVFGSVSGICGNVGQANYAAANTFLGSFTQYRRQLGLPSAILDLGVVEDVGMVSQNSSLLQNAQSASLRLVSEKELIEGLQLAIRQSHTAYSPDDMTSSSCIIGLGNTKPLSAPGVRALWARDARFTLYSNLELEGVGHEPGEIDEIKIMLGKIQQNAAYPNTPEAESTIRGALGRRLMQNMAHAQDLDDEQMSNFPVDSLMAIEIKGWVRRNLRLEISLMEISKAGTVGKLSKLAHGLLMAKHGVKAATSEHATSEHTD
ncbi:Fum1p [Arthroderma uncinatum]|uniref:Fum1p n=1 Tax=Arthroderma uncinatum TaxID=74035 RepID=UPI00144A7086|nr:Fum1p [Arthroderma uncinatum]KAF3484394.1 Fum1p [Arthroderma uncinatum]